MPVPKSSKTDDSTVTANSGPVSTIIETEPVINPIDVTQSSQIQDATAPLADSTAAAGIADASTATATTAPTKPKRGRKAGAPPAVSWDQTMFDNMRRSARRLSAQQVAAGLSGDVNPSTLFEDIKGRYEGFEKVEKGQMIAKYKQGYKELQTKAPEVLTQGLDHQLYIPALASNRAKINFLAPLTDEAE